jgi:hypothetical protein
MEGNLLELHALKRAQVYDTPPSPTFQHIIKNYSVCVCVCVRVSYSDTFNSRIHLIISYELPRSFVRITEFVISTSLVKLLV